MTVTKVRIKLEDVLGDQVLINREALGFETITTEKFPYLINRIKSILQSPEKVFEYHNQRFYCKRIDEHFFWVNKTLFNGQNWCLISNEIETYFEELEMCFPDHNLVFPSLKNNYEEEEEEEDDDTPLRYSRWMDDDFENEDDEDFDDYFVQASHYTYKAVIDLLASVTGSSSSYKFNHKELEILKTILKVVAEPKKYRVKGYLYILVKEVKDEDNHKFHEIQIDDDGLKLSTGGYVIEDNSGGDSYSEVIYPVNDEDDALNIVDPVDNFVSEFLEQLDKDEIVVEVFDSGDGISISK